MPVKRRRRKEEDAGGGERLDAAQRSESASEGTPGDERVNATHLGWDMLLPPAG